MSLRPCSCWLKREIWQWLADPRLLGVLARQASQPISLGDWARGCYLQHHLGEAFGINRPLPPIVIGSGAGFIKAV